MTSPVSVFDMLALQHLWSSEEMRHIFSEQQRVQKWIDFEVALAKTQAALGIIPAQAGESIAAQASVGNIDTARMSADIRRMRHSLVPFLTQLEEQLGEHGEWLHYGVTTQDVIDTGMVLQIKEAHAIYLRDIGIVGRELVRLARKHRDAIMVGRTHGVHALPITFGHKCAIWLDEMSRHQARLRECEPRVFVGMLVGAVGSQAALGPQAREVESRTLRLLRLDVPDISWAPARDRLAEYANVLSMLGATLSKIGNELFNLQRDEVGEVKELFRSGTIGSSTMPHKRNPAAAENLAGLSRALRYNAAMMTEAMVQEHERDGVAWKTEWKALPECCLIAGAMLQQAIGLLSSLSIDPKSMTRNLAIKHGYVMSERVMMELARRVGKQTAHRWVNQAAMDGIADRLDFQAAISQHDSLAKEISHDTLAALVDPTHYLGTTGESIDRTVARQLARGWIAAE
jgi:adenylosuccinate lyase